ncbi:hypothetical protein WN944_018742 [Citrus x changshan-huyou]|uniref:Uncharacterized protein n=1 Tax=Citrus x changshan-huyou TaxID=2935761 RepID=A0AAP0M0C3_9ROSI
MHNLADYMKLPPPEQGCEDYENKMKTWTTNNKVRRMVDNKPVTDQIHDYHLLVNNLKSGGIELPERFLASCLIEKLSESWSDYIKNPKHKKKPMSLEDIIVHIKIEEHNRLRDMARNLHSNANVIKTKPQPE